MINTIDESWSYSVICHSVTVMPEILLRYILSEHDCSNKILINIKQIQRYNFSNLMACRIFARYSCVQIKALAYWPLLYLVIFCWWWWWWRWIACNFIHLFRFHVIIRKNFSVACWEQKLKLVYYFTENQKIRMH